MAWIDELSFSKIVLVVKMTGYHKHFLSSSCNFIFPDHTDFDKTGAPGWDWTGNMNVLV